MSNERAKAVVDEKEHHAASDETRHSSMKEPKAKRIIKRSKRKAIESASEIKRQTFYALEDPAKGRPLAKFLGCALFILILLNAALVFVSTQPGLDPIASAVVDWFYKFSTVCFLVEYIARIWIADLAYGNCTRLRARMKYIISPLGFIDLFSFAPNVVAWFFPVTPMLRAAINIVRLVRLIKISRYMRGLRTIGRVLQKREQEIVASFLVLVLLIVVSSVVMYELEHPAQPDKFTGLLSGVYWAVTTITGVGYGDLVPITAAGRVVGSVIMFLSVALVAIPGGIMSAGFVAEFQNAKYRRIVRDETGKARKAANAVETKAEEIVSDGSDSGKHDDASSQNDTPPDDQGEGVASA